MTTKELIKKEIDQMTDEQVEKTYKIIKEANNKELKKEKKVIKLRSYPLGKELDLIDIRKAAYGE